MKAWKVRFSLNSANWPCGDMQSRSDVISFFSFFDGRNPREAEETSVMESARARWDSKLILHGRRK